MEEAQLEPSGGVYFEHQYGLKLRLGFEAERDLEAHAFAQTLLTRLDDVMADLRMPHSSDAAPGPRKPVLSYGFTDPAGYQVLDPDGTARRMSFLSASDARAPGLAGRSSYAIEMTIEFESDTDEQARTLAGAMVQMVRGGFAQFEVERASVTPTDVIGYEFEGTRPVGISRLRAPREAAIEIEM